MIVRIPPTFPRSLPAIDDVGTTLDNGTECKASPARSMEQAANHLLGARKISGAGSCSTYTVTETTAVWNYTIGKEPFEDVLRALVFIATSLPNDTVVGTVTVTTALSFETQDITWTSTDLADDAREYEFRVDWGNSAAADMGADDVSVTIAMSALSATVYGITFEALGFAPPYGVGSVSTYTLA